MGYWLFGFVRCFSDICIIVVKNIIVVNDLLNINYFFCNNLSNFVIVYVIFWIIIIKFVFWCKYFSVIFIFLLFCWNESFNLFKFVFLILRLRIERNKCDKELNSIFSYRNIDNICYRIMKLLKIVFILFYWNFRM